MIDSIYRQSAIDAIMKCNVKEVTPAYMLIDKAEAMTELMILPVVQPEIIRCKECVHSDTFPEGSDNDVTLKCLGIRYGGVMPDWYCEHAERRTDG